METLKEGGVHDYEHNVPVRVKFGTLTLERGMFEPNNSAVVSWFKEAMTNFKFQPITLSIILLNEEHQPLVTWHLRHVLPKSWKIGSLDAKQNEVLIETMELSYNAFTMS